MMIIDDYWCLWHVIMFIVLQFIFKFEFLKFFLNLKRSMNFFSGCCILFLADHTCIFWSSLVDLRIFCSSLLDLNILISCRQGKMHLDTYFWSFPPLILRILLRTSALCFCNFLFYAILQFDILTHKFQIKYNGKLLLVFYAKVSNFSDKLCCGLMIQLLFIFIIYILTGCKNKSHC